MKKIYLKPKTDAVNLINIEELLSFSNKINNANPDDDHTGSSLEDGGEGSGGDNMGAKRFDLDWDFEGPSSDWDLNE